MADEPNNPIPPSAPPDASPPSPGGDTSQLPNPAASQLQAAEAKAAEYLDGWKRAMADYANLKKEVERAREEVSKFACAGLVEELLPVLDSFSKAASEKPAEADAQKLLQWADGVARVREQFEAALKKAGVAVIDQTYVAFDPAVHEAMLTDQRDGVEPGFVLQVLVPGYKMHDRVIRAAKVTVSK